jgi:rSAM-associated Gly-rich repeat protein
MADANVTRREVLTKAAYMTPAIVTLPVLLSFASAGSGHPDDNGDHGKHKGWENGKHKGWENGKHKSWENGKHKGWENGQDQ